MSTKPQNLGTRMKWWGFLAARLLISHPNSWKWVYRDWERDRDRATNPHRWD